jgi:hypothetical protein
MVNALMSESSQKFSRGQDFQSEPFGIPEIIPVMCDNLTRANRIQPEFFRLARLTPIILFSSARKQAIKGGSN